MPADHSPAGAQALPLWEPLLGSYAPDLAGCVPDFLIVAAPKTGSTWLAYNLACHPQIFVPPVKEIKYFSHFYQWLDLDWYLGQFRAGQGWIKGEASPSYALLPLQMIRQVHAYFPRLKLIFLLREPCARAWSHARHCHQHGEANFSDYSGKLEDVADTDWRTNFCTDWVLASGDYLGQLRRWLAVFRRDQVYVGFCETIRHAPQSLLRELCAFLEVSPPGDWTTFRLTEMINEGPRLPLPPTLRRSLRCLLHEQTRKLETFLKKHFGLALPEEWQETLAGEHGVVEQEEVRDLERRAREVWNQEFDDPYLARVLALDPLADVRLTHECYRGYNIVHFRRGFYALASELGPVDLTVMNDTDREAYRLRHQGSRLVSDALKVWAERS